MTWLFLLAYTCSGLAGLIYQVAWTRLLTLYLGHSTAAASSVVAAVPRSEVVSRLAFSPVTRLPDTQSSRSPLSSARLLFHTS